MPRGEAYFCSFPLCAIGVRGFHWQETTLPVGPYMGMMRPGKFQSSLMAQLGMP
jgi:hypothetical protein